MFNPYINGIREIIAVIIERTNKAFKTLSFFKEINESNKITTVSMAAVSYTHLDVYKRQKVIIINGSARKGNTLTAIEAFVKGASEKNEIEIIEPDKLNIAPVSYTHLDVYKRQSIYISINSVGKCR